jgi:hypothetical protein
MIAEWNRQRDDKDTDEYCARINHPPDHIVEAVTRLLAESDGSFWDGAGEEDGSPFSPSRTQRVSNTLRRAAETTPPMEKREQHNDSGGIVRQGPKDKDFVQ